MLRAPLVFLWLIVFLAGCLGPQNAYEEKLMAGHYDEAVVEAFKAAQKHPGKHKYRLKLLESRQKASWMHFEKGMAHSREGDFKEAITEFELASALNPPLESAKIELEKARDQMRATELIQEAERFHQDGRYLQSRQAFAKAVNLAPHNRQVVEYTQKVKERRTIVDGYDLDVASEAPITLEFSNARLHQVFDILSELTEITFILDDYIKQQPVTISLTNVSFAQALEFIMTLGNLNKKVLNPKTILVFQDDSEKSKQFQDQIIQVFYLSNIDAKKVINILRSMLQLRKVFIHEDRNALIMRDSPEVVRLAQKIIEAADRPDAEVVFDLELIEVGHTDDFNIGLLLSDYSLSAGFGKKGAASIVSGTIPDDGSTARLITSTGGLQTFYTLPNATFSFAKSLSDSEILANPKIRVRNNAKGKVHIGTREPVVTVSTVGDNLTDSVQYVDVGVKLNVEPTINLDDTVVTKLGLEVSSVSNRSETSRGTQVLTITTTNAETNLTLKDGQQTVIGGLIRDDLIESKVTVPILGDIPILGDLFSSNVRNKTKREILLSITPHIVKKMDVPRSDVGTIWSGGEDNLQDGARFKSFVPSFVPELEVVPPSVVPARRAPEPVRPVGESTLVQPLDPQPLDPQPLDPQPLDPQPLDPQPLDGNVQVEPVLPTDGPVSETIVAPAKPASYSVQVGTFRHYENALRQALDMREKYGFISRLIEEGQGANSFIRVCIGEFVSLEEAKKLRLELSTKGCPDCFVVQNS